MRRIAVEDLFAFVVCFIRGPQQFLYFSPLTYRLTVMRKLFSVALLLATSLFLFSCQKEIEPLDPLQSNNGNSGSSGGSAASANSYFPLTAGSWWKYKDSLTGTTSVGTVTSRTKSINNILYTALVSVMGTQSDTSWAASPQPNYYMTAKGVSPSGGSYDILFHYLNDTASVGYHWEYNAGNGNGFTALIKTTIIAKNLTMTVAGKTYNNVIQTRLDLTYDVLGSPMDFGYYTYFIAKGVGVIKVRSDLSMMGIPILQTSSDLIEYSIK